MKHPILDKMNVHRIEDWATHTSRGIAEPAWMRAAALLKLLPTNLRRGLAMAGIDSTMGLYWIVQEDQLGVELYLDCRHDGSVRYHYSVETITHREQFPQVTVEAEVTDEEIIRSIRLAIDHLLLSENHA